MKIIAIANQKGGVGKTTTSINLGAGLALKGYSTLLIDLDMQANATVAFFHKEEIKSTLYDVLVGREQRLPIVDAVYHTSIDNLDLIPANISLGVLDKFSGFEELYRLKNTLLPLEGYEFVLLDCPPNLGTTLMQALLAAHQIIIPIKADYFSMEGVVDLMETIKQARQANNDLQLLGALVTEFDQRQNISGQAVQQVEQMFGEQKFETLIRKNVRLMTAPSVKKTIYQHDANSYGSEDYLSLTEEVLERLNLGKAGLHIVKNHKSAGKGGKKAVNE